MTNIYYKTSDFSFTKDYANFTQIKKGEVIAVSTCGSIIKAAVDGVMVLPRPIAKIGEDLFYTAVYTSSEIITTKSFTPPPVRISLQVGSGCK
jgi:hypothetical protein